QDCDVLRIVATGEVNGQLVEITNQVVVLPYPRWGIGAGALDTGVPLAIAGRMLANGQITRRGAFGPEMCVPVEPFFQELARYDMHVTETRTVAIFRCKNLATARYMPLHLRCCCDRMTVIDVPVFSNFVSFSQYSCEYRNNQYVSLHEGLDVAD